MNEYGLYGVTYVPEAARILVAMAQACGELRDRRECIGHEAAFA